MPEPTFDGADFEPDLAQFDRSEPAPPPTDAIEDWRIRFTGDGGVYFGVWIVNILLTIVTLGLFTPWARRRTIRYFYGHTLVADSPFEFTAGIRGMLFGFLLLAALYIAMNVASETGQHVVYAVIVIGGALLAPFLWGSAMRFRLGHTRWRGLRLRFTARWSEVYRASWPVFALALVWLASGIAMARLTPEVQAVVDTPQTQAATQENDAQSQTAQPGKASAGSDSTPDADVEADPDADTGNDGNRQLSKLPRPGWKIVVIALLASVLSVLCFIRLEFNYKRLLVRRATLGAQHGNWTPEYRDFVRIWLATSGLFLATLAGMVVIALLLSGGSWLASGGWSGRSTPAAIVITMIAVVALFFGFFFAAVPAMAYREARMFQLMWGQIGVGTIARFKTDLRTRSFVWLRIKNTLLNIVTGGFYRPFARVAEYKMKTESVTLYVKGGLDSLVGVLEKQQKEGFGDAVADALGLDVIG